MPTSQKPFIQAPSRPNYRNELIISLGLAILATLFLEHSPLDVWISQHFYLGNGDWLIDKDAQPYAFIFYDFPKQSLIVFELYIIVAWLQRLASDKLIKNPHQTGFIHAFATKGNKFFTRLKNFSRYEIGYLAVAMLLVPTITATLKGVTHVSCPNHLDIFGGEDAYLTIWQSIQARVPSKCFPAAHASAGFALYAWCFVPLFFTLTGSKFLKYRWLIAGGVTLLSWLMGGYKMAIGDHFFSHTVVAMCLAWAICAGMGWVWVKFFAPCYNKTPL